MQRFDPAARREILVVLVFTLLGGVLRSWNLGAVGLTHFDEGIYALSGLWSMSPKGLAGLDPMIIPYAPPGFPILVGAAYFVFGVVDVAPILATILCGVVTIPVAAWIGRRTFGAGAGSATAALTALSMPHLAFSRKALVDVPFELSWLMALGLGTRFLEKPTWGRAMALGIGVGLAQNLKYNGWLAGIVVGLAAVLGLFWHAPERRVWLTFRRLHSGPIVQSIVAACLAASLYWPWYQFVEQHGGYEGLIRHHRSYVGGVGAWYPFWKQQQAQLIALSGGAVWCVLTWSLCWIGYVWSRFGFNFLFRLSSREGFLLLGSLVSGSGGLALLPSLPWWVGLAMLPWLLRDPRPAQRILGSWWLILSIMTPFYHPYARLWLPLHAAGWLLIAGIFVGLIPGFETTAQAKSATIDRAWVLTRLCRALTLAVLVLGIGQLWSTTARPFPLADFFMSTARIRETVAELPRVLEDRGGHQRDLRILGRRPFVFYLVLQARYTFGLVEDLDSLLSQPSEWAVLDEAVLDREERRSLRARVQSRVAGTIKERLDPVTRLDIAPEAATSADASRFISILVLKPAVRGTVRSPGGSSGVLLPRVVRVTIPRGDARLRTLSAPEFDTRAD